MKPSEICKSAGFTLAELVRRSGESLQHLNNLAKKKPRTFDLLVKGVKAEKEAETMSIITNRAVRNIPYSMELNDLKSKIAARKSDAVLRPTLFGWSKAALVKAAAMIEAGEYTTAMQIYDDVLEGLKFPEMSCAIQKKYAEEVAASAT